MTAALAYRSLAEVSTRIQSGETSSETVTRLLLQRIHEHNPKINCFLEVFDEAALRLAQQLDRELSNGNWRGALHGMPVAVKDIFDFPGHNASAGSSLARDAAVASHATLLRKLEAAGAIIIGVLNLDELAAGGTGDNAHFGRCKNPWNLAHISGGSSSGSAAAVSAGLCYASIGSDAGGSIRIPAAFCGVVGLKPSYGRVSRHGAMARTWSMDCIGPLARNCNDAAIVFNAILGQDPRDASSVRSDPVICQAPAVQTASLPIIGVFEKHADSSAAPSDPNYDHALKLLENAGYALPSCAVPDLELYTEMQQVLVKSEGAAMHGRALRNGDPKLSYAVRSVIEGGLDIPAVRYIEALSLRPGLVQSFIETVLGEADLLLMPVSLPSAPPFSPQDELEARDIDLAFSQMATMTRFANYLGLPAISIPSGCDSNGLPTAIQLVGRPFEESLLLSTAAHFESLHSPMTYPEQNSTSMMETD